MGKMTYYSFLYKDFIDCAMKLHPEERNGAGLLLQLRQKKKKLVYITFIMGYSHFLHLAGQGVWLS